ncbi:hypothetical protein AD936_04705 [Gluconobacter japonicus]|nr:hypothetical protein AD936_04705 [Gluconobacter japonicus]OAG71706.1 hypothetical protein A0J51_03119 [Gluconobacter japonicus]GAP25921.1 hypothetical protein GLF_2803 [Gluconobacter frateurii NBRC 101659]
MTTLNIEPTENFPRGFKEANMALMNTFMPYIGSIGAVMAVIVYNASLRAERPSFSYARVKRRR